MRTDEEILKKVQNLKERYKEFILLGATEIADLVIRLPFEKAKPFLHKTPKSEDWKVAPRDRESLLKEMYDYMPFAWDKANDCKGLSASRSMEHYQAWVWLAGDDLGDFSEYDYYGKDHLSRICDYYRWDYSSWDDGKRPSVFDEAPEESNDIIARLKSYFIGIVKHFKQECQL